jgi:hypothetical protein
MLPRQSKVVLKLAQAKGTWIIRRTMLSAKVQDVVDQQAAIGSGSGRRRESSWAERPLDESHGSGRLMALREG